jgi:hypothetical protein
VGGVHISDLVEATTGVNLWREWARIELSQGELPYQPPVKKFHPRDAHGPGRYGGLIVSLAKTEHPDLSGFTDPEIVWRMTDNPFHAGLVVAADTHQRVEELLDQYEERFAVDAYDVAAETLAPFGGSSSGSRVMLDASGVAATPRWTTECSEPALAQEFSEAVVGACATDLVDSADAREARG